jgi:hypothetical protein
MVVLVTNNSLWLYWLPVVAYMVYTLVASSCPAVVVPVGVVTYGCTACEKLYCDSCIVFIFTATAVFVSYVLAEYLSLVTEHNNLGL